MARSLSPTQASIISFVEMAEEGPGRATIESFMHWLCCCYGARKFVYLDGRGHGADQWEILRIVVHKAFNSYYEYTATCGMLVAIRDGHQRPKSPSFLFPPISPT